MSQNNFIINGRSVIHQKTDGFAQAQSINYTGEAKTPIPYTIRAEACDLDNLCKGLMVNGNPCATIESVVSKCSGDESGDGGGIFSKTIGDRCDFLTASSDSFVSESGLLVDGQPVVREGDAMLLNRRNSAPTTWQQEKDKQSTANLLEQFSPSSLATPYLIDVAVLGADPCFSHQYLAIRDEKSLTPRQVLPFAQTSDDADKHWRRISFNHLTPKDKHLMLFIPTDNAQSILIPFPVKPQATSLQDEEKPDYYQQANCFLPVKFCPHFVPDSSKIEPVMGDFSEILRLDDDLRWQVYSRLIHHQLDEQEKKLANGETQQSKFFKLGQVFPTEKGSEQALPIKDYEASWYDLAGPRLRTAIEQYFKAEKTQASLRCGFLYLFLNGKLWRELAFDGKGMLREIDLGNDGGKDQRNPAGLAEPRVYLPWRLAGERFDIDLAFSEVQWSWARISYFGGIDDRDLRFEGKKLPKAASEADAKTRREKRFLKLDLSTFVQAEPGHSVCADNKIIHAFCQEEQLPVIYLPDPLAPIENGLKDIEYLMARLEELAQAIQFEPHFLTATTCYRYFFDERFAHNLAFTALEQQHQKRETSSELKKDVQRYSADYLKHKAKQEFPEHSWDGLSNEQIFDQYYDLNMEQQGKGELAKRIYEGKPNELKEQQQCLDQAKIKAVLKVALRQRIRDMIRLMQQTVVSLLESAEEGFAVTSLSPSLKALTNIKAIEVLRDYFSLGPYHYEKAFSALAGLTTWIATEPAMVDMSLDIRNDFDSSKANAGQRFIRSLVNKDHPMHSMIFANEDAVSQAKVVNEQSHPQELDNDGSGDFSAERYAFSWRCLDSLSMDKILNKSSDIIHQVVSSFAMNVHHAVEEADEQTVKSAHELIHRLFQASNHTLMSSIALTRRIDMEQKEHLIIGLKPQSMGSETQDARLSDLDQWRKKKLQNDPAFNVNINEAGEAVVSQRLAGRANQAIIDAIQAQDELKAYCKKLPGGIAVRKHYKMNTTPPVYIIKTTPLSIQPSSSLDRILEKGSGLLKENAASIDRVATSILSVLALMNLHTVMKSYMEKAKRGNLDVLDKFELYSCTFEVVFSIEALATSLMKINDVQRLYGQNNLIKKVIQSGVKNTFLLTPLAAIGSIAYVFSVCSSLFNLVNLFNEHDSSAAFSRGLLTLVNLGSLFSILGTAVSRGLKAQAIELAESAGISLVKATEQVMVRFSEKQGLRFRVLRFLLPFSDTGLGILLVTSGFILELLYDRCKDEPLRHWVKNCSFSRFALSKTASNKTDFDQVLSLSDLLFKPQARLQVVPGSRKGLRRVCLSIEFPVFIIGKHQLSLRTCLMNKKFLMSSVSNSPALMGFPQEAECVASTIHYTIKGQNELKKIEIYYELNENQIKQEKPEPIPMGVILNTNDIQSFFRLHLEEEMILPAVERNHHYIKRSEYGTEAKDDQTWYLSKALRIT